ncbi:uncharacterized protein LOC113792437 [Dermatophagoides pteronyssinus]|uniref:uncharacterized protein LOC113792437 n=1 Tax=Dermatophagoides pteronyssinus TaxID=6956 RepID=UPI003F6731BA
MIVMIEKNMFLVNNPKLFALMNGIINHPLIFPELTYHPFVNKQWLFIIKELMIIIINSFQILVNFITVINLIYLHWKTLSLICIDYHQQQQQCSINSFLSTIIIDNFHSKTFINFSIWLFGLLWNFCLFELNLFLFVLDILLKARSLILCLSFVVAYTILFYVELKQISKILLCKDHLLLNNHRINQFIYHHHRLFERIMIVDRVLSKSFFWFMIASLPINIYLSAWLLTHLKFIINQQQQYIHHRPSFIHYSLAIMIVLATLLGVFIIHYILALYPIAIHDKSGIKRLLYLEARRKRLLIRYQQKQQQQSNRKKIKIKYNLRKHLKQVNYISKFHVKNRYGFTYSHTGLITLNSFFRSLMIYVKVLILVYKLLSS